MKSNPRNEGFDYHFARPRFAQNAAENYRTNGFRLGWYSRVYPRIDRFLEIFFEFLKIQTCVQPLDVFQHVIFCHEFTTPPFEHNTCQEALIRHAGRDSTQHYQFRSASDSVAFSSTGSLKRENTLVFGISDVSI